LCSPGRWEKSSRRLPEGLPEEVIAKARELFKKDLDDRSKGKGDMLGFMLRLAAGRFEESPFSEKCLMEMRWWLAVKLKLKDEDCKVAEGQAMRLGMLSVLLKELGDPDWAFVKDLEKGVALGVGIKMPRTPEVFEEKTKWNLDEPDEGMVHESGNYGTVEDNIEKVRELFREEQQLGWMEEMTDIEAERRFGKDLYVAALAVVTERDKVRVVHDGTNGVQVNNRIRVRDQVRSPGAGELRALLRERQERVPGTKLFAILGDASKAHRRIKVREADWGLQACRLEDGKIWVNKVGTYGVASAGYYWSRLAAAVIIRLLYYLLGWGGQDALIFADDLLVLAGRVEEIVDVGSLIFLWVSLGVPFKWKKFRGGDEVDWIGYWISFSGFRLGISSSRARWIREWVEKVIKAGFVEMRDFHAFLGRVCFIVGALEYLKPFLAPLYAWAAAVGRVGRSRLPWSVCFLLSYLATDLGEEGRARTVKPRGLDLGVAFRADAKAEGQLVCVGGWECLHSCPPKKARWFSVRLSRSSAPWAFSRGEPFRSIAALELYGTLLSLMVFSPGWPKDLTGMISVSGQTDRQRRERVRPGPPHDLEVSARGHPYGVGRAGQAGQLRFGPQLDPAGPERACGRVDQRGFLGFYGGEQDRHRRCEVELLHPPTDDPGGGGAVQGREDQQGEGKGQGGQAHEAGGQVEGAGPMVGGLMMYERQVDEVRVGRLQG
jgi:hypothetical protein